MRMLSEPFAGFTVSTHPANPHLKKTEMWGTQR
jgi:hypothetical protein